MNKIWRQSELIYIIITSIIALTAFLIGIKFKVSANIENIVEIRECLKERPTRIEIEPSLQAIREDIRELKESLKEYNQKVDKLIFSEIP